MNSSQNEIQASPNLSDDKRERKREQNRAWHKANRARASHRRKMNARAQVLADPEKAKQKNREWYKRHEAQIKKASRLWAIKNPERRKRNLREWYLANAEYVKEKTRRYRRQNKERRQELHAARMKSDPAYCLAVRIRGRIHASLKRYENRVEKASKTIDLLGCSFLEFRSFIESQFSPGMTWALVSSGCIHIDHKKPCAAFDLTDPEQQKQCFHFTNLQPLWAKDNLSKGSRYE